ncbi:MAG: glycosyltransferase family 2 protein [Acidimicrobiales bacterium]
MIPCFNSASLLAETLESVLAEDEGPQSMQIEVVDDASFLDDSERAVEQIGAGRIGYFRQPRNVGPSANFTTCIRRSAGHWVHVLHSDDLVLPGFYSRFREAIEACSDASMVSAQTIAVDAAGERRLGVTPALATADGYVKDAAFKIATTNPLRCVSVVVARAAYERVGGFHPGLFHANDWEMWARVAGEGPVAWVDEPLGLYRVHHASDTMRLHRSTRYLLDCLAAVEMISARFDPREQEQVRASGRGVVSNYGLSVGSELLAEGWFRLAVANAALSVRIDPSAGNLARAIGIMGKSVAGRLGLG